METLRRERVKGEMERGRELGVGGKRRRRKGRLEGGRRA